MKYTECQFLSIGSSLEPTRPASLYAEIQAEAAPLFKVDSLHIICPCHIPCDSWSSGYSLSELSIMGEEESCSRVFNQILVHLNPWAIKIRS